MTTSEQLERAREIVQRFSDARLPGEYWYRLTQAIAAALDAARAEGRRAAVEAAKDKARKMGASPYFVAGLSELWAEATPRALAQDQGGAGE